MSANNLKKTESSYLDMDHGFISFIARNQYKRLEELSRVTVQNPKARKSITTRKKKPDLARYVPPGRRSISATDSEENLAETKPQRGINGTSSNEDNLVESKLQKSAGTRDSEENLAENKPQRHVGTTNREEHFVESKVQINNATMNSEGNLTESKPLCDYPTEDCLVYSRSPLDMDKLFASGLSSVESAAKTSKTLFLVFLEQTEDSKHLRGEFLRKLQREYQTALGNCDKDPEHALRLFTFISTVYRIIKVCGEPLRVLEKPIYKLASTLLKTSSATANIREVCREVAELDITAESCEIHILLNTMKDLIISEDSTEETRGHLVAVLDARARKWGQKYRHH